MTHVELSPPHTPQMSAEKVERISRVSQPWQTANRRAINHRPIAVAINRNTEWFFSHWMNLAIEFMEQFLLKCTELFLASEDVIAAGRLADAADADVVRVRSASCAIGHFVLEQVVGAGLFHAAVEPAAILQVDCNAPGGQKWKFGQWENERNVAVSFKNSWICQ
jgi:hypothetical protein